MTRGDFDGHKFSLVVHDHMELEAEKPLHNVLHVLRVLRPRTASPLKVRLRQIQAFLQTASLVLSGRDVHAHFFFLIQNRG